MTTEGQIKSLPIVVDEIYFCNPHCLIFSMMELMNLPVWRYYCRFYSGSYRALLMSSVISMGQSVVLLPIALLVRHAFDVAIPAGNFSGLAWNGVAIIFLYLLNGGMTLWTRHVILHTTKRVIQQFRDEVLKKFYTLPRAYYSQASLSRLHTIMVQDTERLDIMSNALVAQLIPAFFMSLALSVVLLFLNWCLFLLMLGITPLLFVMIQVMGKGVSKRAFAHHRSVERFSQGVWFVLQMMDLTRIRAAERLEIARQRKKLDDLRLKSASNAFFNAAYSLVQDLFVAAFMILVLIVGGRAVGAGKMSLGEMLSFYVLAALLKNQLHTIALTAPQILEGNESLTTLFEFLAQPKKRPYSGRKRIQFFGAITFDSVSFQYEDRPILRDINLTISPHTWVALAGPSGAGKSTLANLILGFYVPQSGKLYADGCPYDELDMVYLRGEIGVVVQDPILFPGTILENITYGCEEIRLAWVRKATELAAADEFIRQLPKGYETFIGENGLLLLGGQRQQIAIARALVRRPKLLILDEPTNHLDASAICQLMKNLKGMSDCPAILMISHAPEIVHQAEQIYVLEAGQLTAFDRSQA